MYSIIPLKQMSSKNAWIRTNWVQIGIKNKLGTYTFVNNRISTRVPTNYYTANAITRMSAKYIWSKWECWMGRRVSNALIINHHEFKNLRAQARKRAQTQPQPVGQNREAENQLLRCARWPPCSQRTQNKATPRTGSSHSAHSKRRAPPPLPQHSPTPGPPPPQAVHT